MEQQNVDNAEREFATDVADVLERVAYAVIAFCVSWLVANWVMHMPHDQVKEVGLLNAGIAYYSHAATGRIIRAMVALMRQKSVRFGRAQRIND